MPNSRNELKAIAIGINDLLKGYVEIHNAVFRFSWRRMIPLPFIFEAIDFDDLRSRAKHILSELETCNQRIDSLIGETAQKESRFAHFLSEYCMALIETVCLLKKILYQLCLRSENSNEYRLSEYNSQCNLYKEAVNKYTTMGGRLNELYSEFNQSRSRDNIT